jgi:hypothetical protein
MATSPDDLKNYVNTIYTTVAYYTASMSPFLQGVEITQPWQLTTFTNLKIRGNVALVTTLDKKLQDQNFYNDLHSSEHLGTASTGSAVSMDTPGTLGQQVVHQIESRDVGMATLFNNNDPFEDSDSFWDPRVVVSTPPEDLVIPTSLVQICSSPSSFDGVIEPFEIRRVVDRSSMELPYVSHSVKGSLSIVNTKRESLILGDSRDLRNSSTTPFLDSVETFGSYDQPGAFSDADQRLSSFSDSSDIETFYASGSLDANIRGTLMDGFSSGSVTYTAPRTTGIKVEEIFSSRGFDFSQNDNYRYDSIAFGGLLK